MFEVQIRTREELEKEFKSVNNVGYGWDRHMDVLFGKKIVVRVDQARDVRCSISGINFWILADMVVDRDGFEKTGSIKTSRSS